MTVGWRKFVLMGITIFSTLHQIRKTLFARATFLKTLAKRKHMCAKLNIFGKNEVQRNKITGNEIPNTKKHVHWLW